MSQEKVDAAQVLMTNAGADAADAAVKKESSEAAFNAAARAAGEDPSPKNRDAYFAAQRDLEIAKLVSGNRTAALYSARESHRLAELEYAREQFAEELPVCSRAHTFATLTSAIAALARQPLTIDATESETIARAKEDLGAKKAIRVAVERQHAACARVRELAAKLGERVIVREVPEAEVLGVVAIDAASREKDGAARAREIFNRLRGPVAWEGLSAPLHSANIWVDVSPREVLVDDEAIDNAIARAKAVS
jgi:hypothetical protein